MAAKPVPDGFHTVTPYLIVPGVATLIDFLKQAFGATEDHRTTTPDGRVMHAQVKVGDSFIMLGEPMGEWKPMPTGLYLYVPDVDAWYRRAMKAPGAVSLLEPTDQFYGDRMGGVKDPAGNLWWIATHKEDLSKEELARRAEAAVKQRQKKS